MKRGFLVCCVVVVLCGCWGNRMGEEVAEGVGEEMEKAADLYMVVLIYQAHNNTWPDSMEELEAFCTEAREECPVLDWSKYTNVSFEKLPDGRLRVESKASQGGGEGTFSFVLDGPGPEFIKSDTCR